MPSKPEKELHFHEFKLWEKGSSYIQESTENKFMLSILYPISYIIYDFMINSPGRLLMQYFNDRVC
jgi:hypothetical protein